MKQLSLGRHHSSSWTAFTMVSLHIFITIITTLTVIQRADARSITRMTSKNELKSTNFEDYYEDESPSKEEIDVKTKTEFPTTISIKISPNENKKDSKSNEENEDEKESKSESEMRAELLAKETQLLDKLSEIQKYFSKIQSSDRSLMSGVSRGLGVDCGGSSQWSNRLNRCIKLIRRNPSGSELRGSEANRIIIRHYPKHKGKRNN